MFSLIITIVSIALVVALVAATMSHGGDTLTQGRNSADASAFVNAAQQISSANLMRQAFKGSLSTDLATLISEGYMTSAPVVKDGATSTPTFNPTTPFRSISYPVASADVCTQINLNAGFVAGTTAGQAGNITAATHLTNKTFGCDNSTASLVFYFRY